MNLIFRGSLPLKQGESYVSKLPHLRAPAREVFTVHDSVVRCRGPEGDSVPLVVGAHPREVGAPGDSPFEMVDVRGL